MCLVRPVLLSSYLSLLCCFSWTNKWMDMALGTNRLNFEPADGTGLMVNCWNPLPVSLVLFLTWNRQIWQVTEGTECLWVDHHSISSSWHHFQGQKIKMLRQNVNVKTPLVVIFSANSVRLSILCIICYRQRESIVTCEIVVIPMNSRSIVLTCIKSLLLFNHCICTFDFFF